MMKTITKEALDEVLDKHEKWLRNEEGGERADLSYTDLSGTDLSNIALSGANLTGSDLIDADLRFALLIRANLTDANLSRANLARANLSCANLSHAYLYDSRCLSAIIVGTTFGDNIPVIKDINKKVYEAVSEKDALNITGWHSCNTTHCRAGWVVHLAGDEGYELKDRLGPVMAAIAIYQASDPNFYAFEGMPDFFASNEDVMADLHRLVEAA